MNITFFRTLLDFVYPRRCPVCDGAVAPFGSLICKACKDKFTYIREPFCLKCGKQLQKEGQEYCADCAGRKHFYDAGRALFDYRSISDSLYRYKYKGRQEYAEYYAVCMAKRLGRWIKDRHPDALIPVPLHRSKRHIRGYNQAEALARELGRILGIPVRADYIKRVRKTIPMKELSASDRQNNLKKAFKISRNDVKLDTIVIIDDIYTTGSTVDAMSRECLNAGVKKIYFVALAAGKGL